MKNTMIQYFEWYYPSDGSLWKRISEDAENLKKIGVTHMWMPPAYKGQSGDSDVGYAVYDMYDLGEFDQKGSVRTKYGTKDEYLKAIKACHKAGIKVLADVVFNHRMGADQREAVRAVVVDWNDRETVIGEPSVYYVWTKFNFPGRGDTYSDFKWDWSCFAGSDYITRDGKSILLKYDYKEWDENVSHENGNFDYVMGADIDFFNERVVEEQIKWGKWYLDFTGVDGFRLDAVKSIDAFFYPRWLKEMRDYRKEDMFSVAEYWSGNIGDLKYYLEQTEHSTSLFDVALHFRFFDISKSDASFDIRAMFDNTLVKDEPGYAVPFVDNHDTQPHQALESWIEPWFKKHAYATILLRDYDMPCVFYGDLYGIKQCNYERMENLKRIMWIRSRLMEDNVEIKERKSEANCLAWEICLPHPIFVILSNGAETTLDIYNESYFAYTQYCEIDGELLTKFDRTGSGKLVCKERNCSIFILKADYERMKEELGE